MAKVGVFATVGLAFSDTVRAARAMPVLAVAAAIWVVGYILFYRFAPSDSDPGGLLSTLAFGVGSAILLAPIFIAVLRFIILAEVTQRYAFDIRDPRFQAFCGWSIAFVLVNELPISLVSGYTEGDLQVALWLTSRAAAFLFFPAVALVLPAVAVGARDVTLRNAFADIRGSYWRVVAIQALIYFPFLAATLVSDEVSETSTVRTAIYALVWFYSELVWTAATARMFLALANRLRSPAGR